MACSLRLDRGAKYHASQTPIGVCDARLCDFGKNCTAASSSCQWPAAGQSITCAYPGGLFFCVEPVGKIWSALCKSGLPRSQSGRAVLQRDQNNAVGWRRATIGLPPTI